MYVVLVCILVQWLTSSLLTLHEQTTGEVCISLRPWCGGSGGTGGG